jgi:Tol biopolymer transport system component
VAYYEHSPGDNSILSVATTSGTRVIWSTGGPAWPRWSSDGQWIYFSARRPNAGIGAARVHPDGTGFQTIGPVFGSSEFAAVGVSPDGQTLVVQHQGTLLLIDVAAGTTRRLATSICSMPQFSPDGRRIACLTSNSVRIVNSDGSGERVLVTRTIQTVGGVDWSPDGAWLLVTGASSVIPELISVTDGTVIALTKLSGNSFLVQAAFVP